MSFFAYVALVCSHPNVQSKITETKCLKAYTMCMDDVIEDRHIKEPSEFCYKVFLNYILKK